MFKIPFVSETPSTVKTRSGFCDPSESTRATPSFAKSVSRENLLQSSVVRGFNEREEFRDVANNALAVRSFELPEDPSFWKDHNVQVIIRLRPLNNSEISLQGHNRCVRQESCQTITWTGHPESRFTFDVVADENVTQENLFKVAGVPMVENCVGGYNSCMFAYGQTGSGKTHTMLGDIEGGTRRHSVSCGMTPRVFEYLFSRVQKEKEARRDEKLRFNCKCSFLEIYNEQILDLLNPSSINLQIREDLKKGVYVENLTEVEVTSAREVMQQLLEGAANRKVAATNMNRASSRSHSVFTCIIESTWESQGVTHHRFARLNLVDLAGSERQKSSGAEGERLKEATNINKSLSTLGLVIMNLVSISNGKSLHVPYRDSKLTFLLQDSLGGNSKTTIIANISPSSCCSLETLSTLKFAQRAKFIKNNAIVNEDASGDVLAMRMQIQQLKKELSHLRGLINGGGAGNQDADNLSLGLLASPGTLKWECLNGTFSPLTSDKRVSQRKEYEVALVGAFRREKDKDMALQALVAENQAAMQLAKQREDEIQGLKMRLRFREAGIKRLEAVASGKISAETHLLKEKEEHLKEIEVLRAQVDRNQEVTRFAMENLRLKEEIRRLKSLYEEGEVERMNEQITTLQNKLLEALDWKLMHESGPSNIQKTPDLLVDNHELDQPNPDKKSASPWQTSIKEENEFLRVQAIQNQAEIDSLRKKLNSCMEEKATLERHIKDLEADLDGVNGSKAIEETPKLQINLPSEAANEISKISIDDQLELKAMVNAIATASQREAEAHEIAITLTKENDELRAKIKVLIEDNNKLIELYEKAVAETSYEAVNTNAQDGNNEAQDILLTASADEKGPGMKKLEEIEHQLAELQEENEKLMSLYENAMQERDDFKKKLSTALHNKIAVQGEPECPEKLVEVDGGGYSQHCDLIVDCSTGMEIDESTLSGEVEALVVNSLSQCPLTPLAATETAVQMDVELHEHKNLAEANSTMDCSCETAIQHPDESHVLENSPRCSPRTVEEKNSVELDVELDEHKNLVEANSTMDGTCETAIQHLDESRATEKSPRCSPRTVVEKKNSELDVELDEHKNLAEANSTRDCSRETVIEHLDESQVLENSPRCPRTEAEEKNSVELDRMDDVNEPVNVGVHSETVEEKIVLVRKELDKARERLSSSSETVSEFGVLEKAILYVEKLSTEIEATKNLMQLKQQEIGSLEFHSSEVREQSALIYNKLAALKVSLSSITSSIAYFEQREARARARVEASMSSLEQKNGILVRLQVQSDVTNAKRREIQAAETELRKNHLFLKSKLEEENRRLESERVLFAIDNVEKTEHLTPQNSWKLGSKATELLKSEEEKIKLQNQIKQSREKLGALKKDIEELNKKCQKVDNEIQAASLEMEKASKAAKETELGLQNVIHEKEVLLEMRENGKTEIDNLIAEYQQCIFEGCIREEELKIHGEDMHIISTKLDELQTERAASASRATELLDRNGSKTGLPSEKMREELRDVWDSILEAESLLSWEILTNSQASLPVSPRVSCPFTY